DVSPWRVGIDVAVVRPGISRNRTPGLAAGLTSAAKARARESATTRVDRKDTELLSTWPRRRWRWRILGVSLAGRRGLSRRELDGRIGRCTAGGTLSRLWRGRRNRWRSCK